MTRVRGRCALLLALCASFCAGAIVDGWLRSSRPPKPLAAAEEPSQTRAGPIIAAARPPDNRLQVVAEPPTIPAAPADPTDDPSATPLRVPIDGVSVESFKGGFAELRGDHGHEAVDIMVPRGTPIHAVEDGTIAKLFFSRLGGVTIYQFEDRGRLCFYYAHLERYADGLHDNQHVSRGEVVGYVGTSGNAPPGTPHLHFAIFELNADRKWWQGRPLDPYLVFKDRGGD
jgi:murein DD-endopeptidase MepM/ murein hydrolase activator NlpD